jgi:hypothetical protein
MSWLNALSLAAVLTLMVSGAHGQTLRVAVISGRAMPFVAWQAERPEGGLDLEVPKAMAAHLQLRLETLVLPRQRLRSSAQAGEFDLVCGLDPERQADSQLYHWSPPLAELPELLVGTRRAEPVDRLAQLARGTEVGVLLGVSYPALEQSFTDGTLSRAEALDEERLIRKLLVDRHPYAVLSAGQPNLMTNASELQQLAGWRLPIGQISYRCAAPKSGRIPPATLWETLEASRTRWQAKLVPPSLAVVVSTASPLRSLDRHEFVDLYLARRSRLTSGETPRLTMLRGPERQQFLRHLLQRESADYQAAWARQQFGGRQRAPDELADAQALKVRLLRDPLAIGYLPMALVDASLRVVYAN